MTRKRIFSGAQPTGELHIGNYLGALKNWVALQEEYESFYCIVNLHAITLPQDPKTLRQKTLDLARIYLAAGVDPKNATIFIQSDVPEHAELTWILSCVSRMGELERMTQFKDKGKGNTERAGVGLFTYPVLMAADILLYQTDLVPIGQDQKQHLELTRDLAERFNRDFGETFVIPDGYIPRIGAKIMSLQDPAKKMSKSDENANGSIFLLDDADTITKKIKRAVTDSGTEINFDETRPAIKNLLTIFQLLTGKTTDECVAHFQGKGYGDFKRELAEVTVEFLRPFQERVKQYDDGSLYQILKAGADNARVTASATLTDVYKKVGIR
jgi:tryptophanyl-tRNA synthetase